MSLTKRALGVIAVLLFLANLAAQKNDVILVEGTVRWTNDSIRHFPKKVRIESKYDPTFIKFVEVDSLGNYSTYLPYGEYVSSSYINYHWQRGWGEFVRIDEHNSKANIKVEASHTAHKHTLWLDTLMLNYKIPEEGIINNLTEANKEKLDQYILYNLDYYQVPGASLAIFKNGKIEYLKSYGFKNPISKEPITEETLFEVGSITKPVFAFVVMRLVEKKIIDLDKPLYEYLPFEDVAHDERYKLITARHVLSHQTGFPNWAKRNEKSQFDLLFTPGTKYGYSGEGFEYLKQVVVHILDKDIDTIIKEELILPLKLKNFYFKTEDNVNKKATDSFYRGKPWKIRTIEKPMMAYSLVTNPKDLTVFALAIRNRIGLSDDTYDEMFRKHVEVDDKTYRGLGLAFGQDKIGDFYGHSGVTRDFVSMYRYYPDLDIGYIFFVNHITGGWLTVDNLQQFLVTGREED